MSEKGWVKHYGIDVCLKTVRDEVEAIVHGTFTEGQKRKFIERFPYVDYISYINANSETNTTAERANKYDTDKLRFELLPPKALSHVAQVFTDGAKKYGDRNWEKGMLWSRLLGAVLRHIFSWADGKTNDDESGHNHLAHACASLLMLLEYHETHKNLDDRKQKDEDSK